MKLWKSKKATSCVPGKSSSSTSKNEDTKTESGNGTAISVDRAMSPAQSEDSGLAPDRNTTYATITLPRENAQAMGIVFAERTDLSYPPVISSLNIYGPAADFLLPGDRIHQIDGISTLGLANNHVHSVLTHGEGPAAIEIEYPLPEIISQSSLCVTSKLAQITVEREQGCLGLTLRGGGEYPLIVTNVRPHGPVFKTGRIRPGDRLLRVDNISLLNKTLADAQQILKCGHSSGYTNLTIEYDATVMLTGDFAVGPLLIEIERPMNDKLGLILSNYSSTHNLDHHKMDEVTPAGVYIASILPASLADRCGALSIGDQILSVDETVIENTSFTPDDVTTILDNTSPLGYTTLQILPAYAMQFRRGLHCSSPKYGFNTIDSRKTATVQRARKFTRKSSLPPDSSAGVGGGGGGGGLGGSGTLPGALCRSETVQVVLDCSHGSGICLGPPSQCGRGYIISQLLNDSVAERSGCIQKGDRLLSVNKLYSLDAATIRQILGDLGAKSSQSHQLGTNWVELEIEFDIIDSVIPSSGVFNVKLAKNYKHGLGITVNGSNHGSFIITEVKPGSPAHRTGSLRSGDILLAVDSLPLQHFNIDSLLKENKNDYTTLTIKRNCLPDFLFDAQQRNNLYNMESGSSSDDSKYKLLSKFNDMRLDDGANFKSSNTNSGSSSNSNASNHDYFHVNSEANGGANGAIAQIRRPFFSRMTEMATANRILESGTTPTIDNDEDPYSDPDFYNIEYPPRLPGFTSRNLESSIYVNNNLPQILNVRLETNGGPLGVTLAGSEDLQKPILISGLTDGGIAQKAGQLRIGDQLLAINNENVQGTTLSHATKLLQKLNENIVELKISRVHNDSSFMESSGISPQPQAIYAQIQRRPRSPSVLDSISNASREGKYRTLHVTLFKDKVYDDYGFSVSDGLYEKGVFINRIRSGGPADLTGVLKPFDRIMQVNGTKTQEFDCCLTVPLIAAAGDQIDLIVERALTDHVPCLQ